MATFTARTFGAGEVQAVDNAIYAVASGLKSYVKSIMLYNTSALSQAIVLTLSINSSSRVWRQLTLEVGESASVLAGEEALILSDGNQVLARSTTGGVVNYSIHGVEEQA